MAKVEVTLNLAPAYCPSCGVILWILQEYREHRENDHAIIYCPNGHPLHFPGETEEERLKKLLTQKNGQVSELEKEVAQLKAKGKKGVKHDS